MDRANVVVAPDQLARTPPDDFAQDVLAEMANLDEQDTGIPGTIFISTALGSHGPRVKWYPGVPGRQLPCLVMSIGADPLVRDDFLPRRVSRPIIPLLTRWVRLNETALSEFWNKGETWNRRQVAAFLDGLERL